MLARDNQVLFVDPPTSLVRRRTLHRGRLERGQDDVVRLEPPPHLPARALSFGPVVAVERHRYGAAVSRAVRDLGWDRPVLWNASPRARPIALGPLVGWKERLSSARKRERAAIPWVLSLAVAQAVEASLPLSPDLTLRPESGQATRRWDG